MEELRLYILDIAGLVVADHKNHILATNYVNYEARSEDGLVLAPVVLRQYGLFRKRQERRAVICPDPIGVGEDVTFMRKSRFITFYDYDKGVIVTDRHYNSVLDLLTVPRRDIAGDLSYFHSARQEYDRKMGSLETQRDFELEAVKKRFREQSCLVNEPTLLDILNNRGIIDVAKYRRESTNL
jgi:hypothetical protein